ncbi:MAG: DUF433 domain-containing protein [Phormidesmis sp.]
MKAAVQQQIVGAGFPIILLTYQSCPQKLCRRCTQKNSLIFAAASVSQASIRDAASSLSVGCTIEIDDWISLMNKFDRITFDPSVMAGQACIRGIRITVSLILNLLANGRSEAEIIDEYPELDIEDIHQSLSYAASLL